MAGAQAQVSASVRLAGVVRVRPPKVSHLRRTGNGGGQTVRLRYRRMRLRALSAVLAGRGRLLCVFGHVRRGRRERRRARGHRRRGNPRRLPGHRLLRIDVSAEPLYCYLSNSRTHVYTLNEFNTIVIVTVVILEYIVYNHCILYNIGFSIELSVVLQAGTTRSTGFDQKVS